MSRRGQPQRPGQPVARWRVGLGALVALAVLAGIIGLSEVLRHPHPAVLGDPAELIVDADPREEIECPEPEEIPDAASVAVSDLYSCPRVYDGRRVRLRGELVGALLERRAGVWSQLNDDVYAGPSGALPSHRFYAGGGGIGVLLPAEFAAQVAHLGGPSSRGDRVELTGVFHRVDRETAEVAIIRVEQGELLSPGGPTEQRPRPERRIAAAVLVPVALALVVVQWVLRRRRFW